MVSSLNIYCDFHWRYLGAHPAISHCSHLLLKKCRVATNISHWLKVQCRLFNNYISVEKVYFDHLLDFQILLLLFLHSLLVCHILLFKCWIFFNTIRVSNSLDPGKARHVVGPDLGPNCLQRLSADDKTCH